MGRRAPAPARGVLPHPSFQGRLEETGLAQSASRRATCLGDVCMEGFFGHLKGESCRGRDPDSFESCKERLDGCIDYWNVRRYRTRPRGGDPGAVPGSPRLGHLRTFIDRPAFGV